MNIGIVTVWGPTGAGYVSKAYAKTFAKKHSVFIYARHGKKMTGDEEWDGGNVCWAPPHPCLTGIHRNHFKKWIHTNRVDIVFFNEQHHWDAVVVAKKEGVLVGAYVDYYTAETVPFFELYDFLICNTKRHYTLFKDHRQCVYCPWGVDSDSLCGNTRGEHSAARFMISAGWDGRYVAQGAPWMDRRGAGVVMRVFNSITAESSSLTVFSQVPLADCPKEWQECVHKDRRIRFVEGTLKSTPYSDYDVYLYPSRLDGIGLTLPEALSYGVPAITTDCAPMSEFVTDQENGLLVQVKEYRGRPDGYYWAEAIVDEEDLARAIDFYIKNPSVAVQHGKNAQKRALYELDWANNSSFLLDWIERQTRSDIEETKKLSELANRALFYDELNEPTPRQRLKRGFIRLCRQAIGRPEPGS